MKAKSRPSVRGKKPMLPSESRRGFIRVDFDPGSKVHIGGTSGQKGLMSAAATYDALDLTVYGVSFFVTPDHVSRFAMGTSVPVISFTIQGRLIQVVGRVAYIRADLASGLAKVAIEFTQISIDDVWFLSRYVAEKAGVNKPSQIGKGAIRLNQLKKAKPVKKAAPKSVAKKLTKTKSIKSGAKTKVKAKSRPLQKSRAKTSKAKQKK